MHPEDEMESADGQPDNDLVACAGCRRRIYEDAPRCPYCGAENLSADSYLKRHPRWILLGVILALLAMLLFLANWLASYLP